ncbi:MAG TPA: TetR/AcrR family transcriptional regulator [Kineosporiaceae bacterium]|nr:TetR/AcrR family transcriptional regulator [Kineosporiaceae bacterium]
MVRPNAGTKGVPRLDRENQILDVASAEFGEHGYAGASIARIAERAGISKPLIYSYFDSKEGLFLAAVERAGTVIADEIERIAHGSSEGLVRALETLQGIFTILEPQPYIWKLFFDESAPRTGPIAAAIGGYRERITKTADQGVTVLLHQQGVTHQLDISAMTAVWLSVVDALVNWWLEHPDQTAEQMTARCVRLIGALFGEDLP